MPDPTMAELIAQPIGYLTVIQFSDGQYDQDVDVAGLWPTAELAAADAAEPEQAGRLAEGQSWRVCAVVPVEDGGAAHAGKIQERDRG